MKYLRLIALLAGVAGTVSLLGCGGSSTGTTTVVPPPITPGTLTLSSSSVNVQQSVGSATVMVDRSSGSSGAVAVNYATSDGTALAGTDYSATTGTLLWSGSDTTAKSFAVPVTTTPGFAGTKSFNLTLSGATGGAVLGAATGTVTITGSLIPPSNFFNLSGVKLQLPIDQYGGTGGVGNIQYAEQEITSAQLTAGFADAYFYADSSNRMVFVDPSNGAVSTPGSGSDHTRSELRELYAGTGADSNNDWTSTIGGTLTASCIVQSVSADSDEATIAQIHNQSYVFALLMYRPANNDIAFDLYSSLGSSSHVRTSMVQNISLGTAISYTLVYKGNSIAVTVNGVTQNFAVDPSWAGTPMYFKLGAYHAAPNIGNPAGDHTQTAFSSFAISH